MKETKRTKRRQNWKWGNKQNTDWTSTSSCLLHCGPASAHKKPPKSPKSHPKKKKKKMLYSAHKKRKISREGWGEKETDRESERRGNSVRTASLHNTEKQHGSYQRGAPGLLQVAEWRIALTHTFTRAQTHAHTHAHRHTPPSMQQMAHIHIDVLHPERKPLPRVYHILADGSRSDDTFITTLPSQQKSRNSTCTINLIHELFRRRGAAEKFRTIVVAQIFRRKW